MCEHTHNSGLHAKVKKQHSLFQIGRVFSTYHIPVIFIGIEVNERLLIVFIGSILADTGHHGPRQR